MLFLFLFFTHCCCIKKYDPENSIRKILNAVEKLEALSFTNSSIYSNQNEVDKKHEEFKQRSSNAISIRIQIENYSSKLLGDPLVSLACNLGYQIGGIHDVTAISPLTKNVFIYNNDHGGKYFGYRTCGALSFQIKQASDDSKYLISKVGKTEKGLRLFIPWYIPYECNTYINKFQVYYEPAEIDENGNWKYPLQNLQAYWKMTKLEDEVLGKQMAGEKENLYFYNYKAEGSNPREDKGFHVVGIINRKGCHSFLRVIIYEDGVEEYIQRFSPKILPEPLVRRRYSNIYKENRQDQTTVIGYILFAFAGIMLAVGLIKYCLKKL
ncbi:uncharacterized protein LOC111702566 [Eurytemora carolleeae]|uniref:uncharacterized protein LOC111702566 n=1 Tax=Eurytemora carolleeae TaxID=1294199 RepID=UPI000C7814FD|nr:uncharacterized protein LOC111702566 [Eurytemora carolleeae]|eukprot:XP_023330072.1 uncharacterized protein LOC111702566 [Eurytemora affinis]